MATEKDFDQLMNKVKKMEAGHKLDLSSDEDLSIAVMNLISIEEHLFYTAKKTENSAYYDVLFEVREMRKELLKMLIKEYEGEVWCISKHLLAASMRLMEVGTKALTAGDHKRAENLFTKSWDLYNLFWGLNLKMIDKKKVESLSSAHKKELAEIEEEEKEKPVFAKVGVGKKAATSAANSSSGLLSKLGNTIGKALDCCRE